MVHPLGYCVDLLDVGPALWVGVDTASHKLAELGGGDGEEGGRRKEGRKKEAEGKGGGRHGVGEVSQEWMAMAVYIAVLWLVEEVSSHLF